MTLNDQMSRLFYPMVLIGTTQSCAEDHFRLIKVIDSKGNVLQLITNRFELKFAAKTIKGWLLAYRRGGFEALKPKRRSD